MVGIHFTYVQAFTHTVDQNNVAEDDRFVKHNIMSDFDTDEQDVFFEVLSFHKQYVVYFDILEFAGCMKPLNSLVAGNDWQLF